MSELTQPTVVQPPVAVPVPGGRADVAYVLLLGQAALGMLASLGVLLLMAGNPVYLVAPLLHATLLFVLASFVARRRRWAWWGVVVLEALSLAGFALNLLIGLLPQVDMTLNLVGLLTQVGLPAALLWQCVHLLAEGKRT